MRGLLAALNALLDSFLHLLALESKQAGISLAFMLGYGLAAAVLIFTGWIALVACLIVALVVNDVIGWPVALIVAAALCFAASGGLAVLILQRSKDLLFSATRRQFRRDGPPDEKSSQRST